MDLSSEQQMFVFGSWNTYAQGFETHANNQLRGDWPNPWVVNQKGVKVDIPCLEIKMSKLQEFLLQTNYQIKKDFELKKTCLNIK